MARLALVSRNPIMAMGLSAIDHDIIEVRPNALDDWLEDGNDASVDALVLDLGSAGRAIALIGDLRASGRWTPVLLVTNDGGGWESPDLAAMPGVDFLSLPIDSSKLQAATDAVLRHPKAPPNTQTAPAVRAPERMPPLRVEGMDVHKSPSGPDLDERLPPDVATLPGHASRSPEGHASSAPLSAPVVHPKHKEQSDLRAKQLSSQQLVPEPTVMEPGGSLVTALLGKAQALFTLTETAEAVVRDAVSRASADAGTLLVPDGEVWRVAGGMGLRPLEHRYQLQHDSWLVERVGESGRGILIENSDVARRHLRGAPLASRAYLLAVPVRDVAAILLLAREQGPAFTESILGHLAELAQEAAPLLGDAIQVRNLARVLSKHIDPEQPARD